MDNRSGSYALLLHSAKPFEIVIGKLGKIHGKPGYYIYCGSAFGPGGIAARVKHHRRIAEKPHWHIDYLRKNLAIQEVWYCYDPAKREHGWSQILANYSNSYLPMRGFGSSDCQCDSHLIYCAEKPSLRRFSQTLRQSIPDHETVLSIALT